jgi:hypothetical protein
MDITSVGLPNINEQLLREGNYVSFNRGYQFETSISNQLRDNHSHARNLYDFILSPDIGGRSSASGRFLPATTTSSWSALSGTSGSHQS